MKRGNTAAASVYTGPLGELVVDTGLGTLRLQDGVTAGGLLLATQAQAANIVSPASYLPTYTGNIGANTAAGYLTIGNVVSSNYLYANGVNILSSISAGYGNANVAAYLASGTDPTLTYYSNALSSNIATVTAAITAANTASNTALQTTNANIGLLYSGNVSTQANIGAYQTYANTTNAITQANIGALYSGNISTQANIGLLYSGNISTQANLGAYQTYANTTNATTQANIGTLYSGNITTQANLGAFQISTATAIGSLAISANANTVAYLGKNSVTIGTISANTNIGGNLVVSGNLFVLGILNYINTDIIQTNEYVNTVYATNLYASTIGNTGAVITGATLGLANTGDVSANIGALYSGNISTQANLGAFQISANTRIQTHDANIGLLYSGNISTQANLGSYQTYANVTNATTQANLGAFQTYANTSFITSAAAYGNSNVALLLSSGTVTPIASASLVTVPYGPAQNQTDLALISLAHSLIA